jgi:oxygen-independent coproporphyrinogen-3 oxidase
MPGIYIHVPFCKTRCIYCDFFTRTSMEQKNPYVSALCKEIDLAADYLNGEPVSTIYFGGGTPSQLSKEDFTAIFEALYSTFSIKDDAEITLEANPDDLNEKYIRMLLEVGFNRLSMGVQSFHDTQLQFLNRRHSAEKAIQAVTMSQNAGFNNISIDLMYGLPNLTMPIWKETLDKAIELNTQHISSYHLIYEKGTKLYRLLNQGEVKSVEEELSVEMFSVMIDRLKEAGYIHYEISNFGKEGFFSRHNSSYWLGESYLGLGPSAHSYNKTHRSWNISSIPKYIKGIEFGYPEIETEFLDEKTRYNDFILTGLRTMWGINIIELKALFGEKMLLYCEKNIKKYIQSNDVILDNTSYKITRKGIFISDSIMSDLMYIE